MSDVQHTNLHYSIYKNLFISEVDCSNIRDAAALILSADPLDSVCNAYIGATIAYLDKVSLLATLTQCPLVAQRRAELADRALKKR